MQTYNKFNLNTQIVGVIGHPIKHSFSPMMHNISFELLGLNYVYLPFDVPADNLKAAIKGMLALGIKGFNVTLPHKEKIAPLINEVSEEASVIGAINTVVNEDGILHGYNTDVNGIVETLEPYRDQIADNDVVVIGAGGAARSVIYALIRHFKVDNINLVNRTEQKAESMKEYFAAKMLFEKFRTFELVPPDLVEVFKGSKLIINTTSIGMTPEVDDSATTIAESFMKGQLVFDIVYNPLKTTFIKLAEQQGATTINGLKMFVEQGARSFELWTGEKMPSEKIYRTLHTYLDA